MNVVRTLFLFCIMAIGLSGCTAARTPALVSLLEKTTVTEADVDVSGDLTTGIVPGLDGISDSERAVVLASALKESLKARLGALPQGGTPTRLHVTITHVDAATDAGRALLGNVSRMHGTAELRDIQTGAKLAELGQFSSAEGAMTGGGLGLPVAFAVNMITNAQQSRIAALTEPFADNVVAALKP